MRRAIIPILLLVILAVLGCGSKTSELETGGLNAVDLLNHLNDRTVRILGEVTNLAKAEEALPQLEAVNKDYDRLIKEADKLSLGARNELAEQAARMMPGLKDNTRRLAAKKDVGELLGPVLAEMVGKLSQLM